MEIKGYHKGHATKTVSIIGHEGHSQVEIINLAMQKAGETEGSLFGYRVSYKDDFSGPEIVSVAVVSLHTD